MTCLTVSHRMHSEKLFDSLEGPGFDSPHLHQMKKIYDVAIIGAGIVGMSTALKLQEKGKNVLVLDKEKSPGMALGTLSIKPPPVIWETPLILILALLIRVIKEL